MPTTIFVQDRNNIVPFNGELFSMPVFLNGNFMGINLYSGRYNLGTFYSIAEVMEEIDKIHRSKDECYLITSFISSFRDWEVLKELMREDVI